MKDNFYNTSRLVRFMLRRERVISAIWIIIMVFFSVALVPGVSEVLGSGEDKEAMLTMLSDPSMIAMLGPIYSESTAGLFAFMMLLWTMLAIGIMNIFLIVRHTRADEERNRAEVVRSLPVGRLATLNAVMIVALIVNTVLALLTGLGMFAMNVGGFTFSGCMLYGALLGVFGLFCAALTAVFCQLCVSSRGALAFPGVIMVALYMVRAIGDMPNEDGVMELEALSYMSPMGLLQRSQVFVNDYWWPVTAVLLITAVVTVGAFILNRIRDIDQGFIPAKPGRKTAKRSLLSSFGLSWRLSRNTLIWWSIGMFLIAAMYGVIMGDIGDFIESNEFYGQLMIDVPESMGNMQAQSFVATINIMLSICIAIPVLAMVFKLRREESDGRLEHILSRSVSRTRNLAGYTAIGFITSLVVPFVTATGFYISSVSVMEEAIPFSFFLENSLVYLPALWVMLGIGVLLVGAFPKATVFTWGYIGYTFFIMFFGGIVNLPDFLKKTTPFGYIPMLIIEDINWFSMAVLTLIAALLTVIGLTAYRKRDMI
jgi:ABC-2 type transport system permease protein